MRYILIVSEVVIVCAVACGGDDSNGGRLGDAPMLPKDAAGEPPIDTSAPGPITLTVTRNGQPVADVHTYFLAADGSLGATIDTNSQGVASSLKGDGGSVTAVDPFAGVVNSAAAPSHDLRTFVGVKAGDHLVLSQNDPLPVTITLTAKPVEAADRYAVVTTCGTGAISAIADPLGASAPAGEITLSGCNGTADILVIAHRIEVSPVVLYRANVPLTQGGEVNLTGDHDTYQEVESVAFNYMHLLQLQTDRILTSYTLATARGPFWELGPSRDDDIEADDMTVTIGGEPMIAGATGLVATSLTVRGDRQPDDRLLGSSYHVISRRPAAQTYDIDMTSADNALPPAFFRFPSYNPTIRRVSWVEAPGGAAPDLTIATLRVSRDATAWRWTLAAPYTPGEVRFPTLPTDVADFTPAVDDDVTVEQLVNAKVAGHYDAVRAHVLDTDLEAGVTSAALATAGTIVTVAPTTLAPRPRFKNR